MGKASGMWEAIHPMVNFNVDSVIVDEVLEMVLLYDVLRYDVRR